MKTTYEISYYNKVFGETYTVTEDNLSDAIKKAESLESLFEMKNVKLREVKEIDFKNKTARNFENEIVTVDISYGHGIVFKVEILAKIGTAEKALKNEAIRMFKENMPTEKQVQEVELYLEKGKAFLRMKPNNEFVKVDILYGYGIVFELEIFAEGVSEEELKKEAIRMFKENMPTEKQVQATESLLENGKVFLRVEHEFPLVETENK